MRTPDLEDIKIETDDTDHFWFRCPSCGTIMKVTNHYDSQTNQVIFLLECQICKGTGSRKISLGTFHTLESLKGPTPNTHAN
jgi:uncharacterized C2H2 Zn-finger protein